MNTINITEMFYINIIFDDDSRPIGDFSVIFPKNDKKNSVSMVSSSKEHPAFFVSFCAKLDKWPKRNVK